jgi:hypothetical protein
MSGDFDSVIGATFSLITPTAHWALRVDDVKEAADEHSGARPTA